MMNTNIILVSNVAIGCGYGDAVNGIYDVLNRMKESGQIMSVASLNINDPLDHICFPDNTVGLFIFHPNQLIDDMRMAEKIRSLISKLDRSYLSVVWETNKLPDTWAPLFRDVDRSYDFDGFLAPSVFMYNHLRKVTSLPVFYYPHYIKRKERAKVVREKNVFRVLFVGQQTERKGFNDAITAMVLALGDKTDVEFILKYSVLSAAETKAEEVIRSSVVTNSKVQPALRLYSTCANYSEEDINNLYESADVLLFPSRGEGFGLPPCIAMSYGVPVIYVPWSATAETCDNDYNYCVDYYLDIATGMAHYGYSSNMWYAKPYMSSLVTAIKRAYTDFQSMADTEYFDRAETLVNFVDDRYGYNIIMAALKSIIMNEGNNISAFPYTTSYTAGDII